MKAMVLRLVAPIESAPLEWSDVPTPEPGPGEVRIRVRCCAICRTDLHVIEGDLPQEKMPIIPGHQIVGIIDKLGPSTALSQPRLKIGQRVGVAWLRHTCGHCGFCVRGQENLCESARFTGYHADGGYAEYAVAPADFCYELPEGPALELPSPAPGRAAAGEGGESSRTLPSPACGRGAGGEGALADDNGPDPKSARAAFSDIDAAPLLCSGIIGYRALRRCNPRPGCRLALYGFGSSAHVVIQIALHRGCEVYVVTRGENHRRLAIEMGAVWAGETAEELPVKVHSAIMFAPAGELVPPALEKLEKGGTLSLAGIYMTPIPEMDYMRYVFYERDIHSVTCNTRQDGRELLAEAAAIPIRPHTTVYPLADANRALLDLKQDRINGTGVLVVDET
ncbi:MAG: zinc-dependent alcohol dehydrogenase family protein [Planctomycetaceae bacterium]|nr:zinc-dependent alcohol dehydrogenase family protein [Planctomycetaceae bacterium]